MIQAEKGKKKPQKIRRGSVQGEAGPVKQYSREQYPTLYSTSIGCIPCALKHQNTKIVELSAVLSQSYKFRMQMILWQNDKGEDSRSEEMMNVQEKGSNGIHTVDATELHQGVVQQSILYQSRLE